MTRITTATILFSRVKFPAVFVWMVQSQEYRTVSSHRTDDLSEEPNNDRHHHPHRGDDYIQ